MDIIAVDTRYAPVRQSMVYRREGREVSEIVAQFEQQFGYEPGVVWLYSPGTGKRAVECVACEVRG
jgi:hypothetical protein